MFRKYMYQWHRTLSLIIAVPVILWAISGFMHPIMTNIRPKIATQMLVPDTVNNSKLKTGLANALKLNKIDSFTQVRLVHITDNWFYQVQISPEKEPVYLAAANGKILKRGNWLYAQYLAKQFLEGQEKTNGNQQDSVANSKAEHDCCDEAARCVLTTKKGAAVTEAILITSFDEEYKSINKILPVYKVSFNRTDGIRIYVETTQDRFCFAVDNQRALFNRLFVLIHSFGWLDFMGNYKLTIEIALTLGALLTTLFGLYIFFTTQSKKSNGNKVMKIRKMHRISSVSIALFTLMFSFSGAYHALKKFSEDTRYRYFDRHVFTAQEAILDLQDLTAVIKKPITNVSLVSIYGKTYWQVSTQAGHKNMPVQKNSHQMKNGTMPNPAAIYVSVADNQILPKGEIQYARYLANLFSKHTVKDIQKTETITKFAGEYGFANKRLPVWKVSYASNYHERYYVETATGKLSVRMDDVDMLEGYSFAFLHKHEFLTPISKGVKDFSTMFWAAAQVVMVVIGLVLYIRVRNRMKKSK